MATNQVLEKIRRNQILEAATIMISANGTANVTMEEVAKAAELSKGGVAYYFSSKNELFMAAYRAYFDSIFERGRTTMALFDDPLDKVLSYGWLYSDDEPRLKETGYPMVFDGMAMAVRDPEYRRLFTEWVDSWIELLKGALDEGVEQGRFAVDDTDKAARAISSIYHGFAIRWYLDPESHPTKWVRTACSQAIKRYLGC